MIKTYNSIVCTLNTALSGFGYWMSAQKARLSMQDLGFSQLCCYWIQVFLDVMLCYWVSGSQHFFVGCLILADEGAVILWNAMKRSPDDVVSHPRNMGYQGSVYLWFSKFFLSQSNLLYAYITVFWSWHNSWWCIDSVEFSKVNNNRLGLVRFFKVLPFLCMEITLFQDVMTCMVKIYQRFGEICRTRLQGCHCEDGFGIFLWNVDMFVLDCMTSHPRQLQAPGFTIL